ncbi:hypothetical protein PFBG_03889 [Plasmodium falciparum 7G8]|uniref:Uncharacterized protein n=2 Tax=Plasmodium falciparum TaxID=5833 RepID=W7EY15_PLAF8|nr:hypothetical protein PFBG_03889 [Plasmodium falciparum 7G8]
MGLKKPVATQGGGQVGGSSQDAKHVLDEFGQQVYNEKVKTEAQTYKGELEGLLTSATLLRELVGTTDTCTLVKEYYERVNKGGGGKGERYPCTNLKGNPNEERFSNTLGGQCTNEKMRSDGIGACAPYRRLHLCHHNLESIQTNNYNSGNAKHDLLAEVCMAAKYEGESLTRYHREYQHKYGDSPSQLCTVLARSFADIGDIIRGKDLFYGNTQEKEKRDKLEDNLKNIFAKIHSGLSNNVVKDRYQNDGDNYYKLREDWWTANRETVWKAMTCSEDLKDASYFRQTCSNGQHKTQNNCRCENKSGAKDADQVPTYFDYVPQYLRWFEEWAEDFCRLRKHKLKNAKEQCRRVEKGEHKYCDLNRHDCVKTIRGDHDFVEEDYCNDCSVACKPFVKWIDNQKLEFLKQREKYKSEMQKYKNGGGGSGSRRQKRDAGGATTTNYDGYEKKFYEKFKGKCGTVNKFLQLLNNETTCTKNGDIEEGGNIDFKNVKRSSATGDDSNKTFYRTTYCEACPWCGAEQERNGGNGKWIAKRDETCGIGKEYGDYKKTEIPILTGDTRKSDMVQKYKKFCDSVNGKNGEPGAPSAAKGGGKGKNGDNITETWECYYKKKNENDVGSRAINFCVLQDDKAGTSKKKKIQYVL